MDNTGRYAGLVPDFEPREAPQSTTGSKSDLIDGLSGRVTLVKTLYEEYLPLGVNGTIVWGTMEQPGMLLVDWDNGHRTPMYRNELKAI